MHAHLTSTSQRAAALRRLTLCGWLFQQTCRSFLHLRSLKSSFPGFPLCLLQRLEFHPIPHTPTVLDSSLAQHLLLKFVQIIFNHLYWVPELCDQLIHKLHSLNVPLDPSKPVYPDLSVLLLSTQHPLLQRHRTRNHSSGNNLAASCLRLCTHSPPYTPFSPCPRKGTPFVPLSLNGISSVLSLCHLPLIASGEGMFLKDDSPG